MKTKMIRIPKRGGGTRLQKVQVLPSGKYKFMKNPSKSRPKGRTKTKRKKTYGGRRRVARRRRRGRRRGGMTIPLAPIGGLIAGMAPAVDRAMKGDYIGAINQVTYNYTGWDPHAKRWSAEGLKQGLLPLVVGLLVHKFVGGAPLNLNRTLARAKVPFIRI